MNGTATSNLIDPINVAVDELRITEAINDQTGAAWWDEPLNDKQGIELFQAQFDYQVLTGTDSPADGVGLVLQNIGTAAMGGGGGGAGFAGIGAQSAGVFLDIYGGGDPRGLKYAEAGVDPSGFAFQPTSAPLPRRPR